MKKRILIWLVSAIGILAVLPWLTVRFVPGDGAMAACFLLFYLVDPVFQIGTGILAGRDPKRLWALPLAGGGLFLAGAWLLFDRGEPAFIRYAAAQVLLGYGAMGWQKLPKWLRITVPVLLAAAVLALTLVNLR